MTYAIKQGTGLGLPFCKRVITVLGGGIEVHSTPDEDAKFRLHFPPVTAAASAPAMGGVPARA